MQNTLETDCKNWEKIKNEIDTRYYEFKLLKDPLCEDDSYDNRVDIISNRWSSILNRLQNNLTHFKVSQLLYKNVLFYNLIYKMYKIEFITFLHIF